MAKFPDITVKTEFPDFPESGNPVNELPNMVNQSINQSKGISIAPPTNSGP